MQDTIHGVYPTKTVTLMAAFTPGHTKVGGRQPGSTNKTTLEGRQIALNFADEAMQTAVDIMRDASAPPTTRLAAAIDIMNRAWGKPTQAVSVDAESAQPLQIMIRHFTDNEVPNSVGSTELKQDEQPRLIS